MEHLKYIKRIQRWWRKCLYIDVCVVFAATDPITPWFLQVKNKKHHFVGRRKDSCVCNLKKVLAEKVCIREERLVLFFGDILLRDDLLLRELTDKDVVVYDMVKKRDKGIRLQCYTYMFEEVQDIYTRLLCMFTHSQQKVLRCLTNEQVTSDVLMFF